MRNLVWSCLVLLGCEGQAFTRRDFEEVPEVEFRCDCVDALAAEAFSPDDIAALPDAIADCLQSDPAGLEADAQECLPVTLGSDERNDLDIVAGYFCSDVCPDAGSINITYSWIEEADCCAAGGVPNYDFAWGAYMGCFPPETPGGEAMACE